ncbi:amidase [Nocardioides sp. IC4_145]|uniref:amidase n=1 Tax=Nocardioides sp. IC4_145 TaxID=2714037 RepID=UPI00140C3FAD|nr:amidase family protein [Nocardioides sp. IC4_145]NHC23374.1 amidase [Nocardioides sp. IC4_145]
MADLADLDATGLAAAVAAGEVSAREVAEAAIARLEEGDGRLNVMVSTRYEEALAEVDAGLPDGPLRGVPLLVKDLGTYVAGLPATGGSRLFADAVADRDSEVVTRYRQAGMVVLGTTNTPELGLNASTEPQWGGPTRNPWAPDRSPGGSSGGSAAAVAAGLVPVAHASDGGGSIRIPASACGLLGLKPSRGRVTTAPSTGSLSNLVSVHHAVTTTVRDSALLLDLTAGPLPGDAYVAPTPTGSYVEAARTDPGRLRIGMYTVLAGRETHPECVAATLATARLLEELGHEVVPIEAPYDAAEVAARSGLVMGANLVVTVQDRLAELGRDLREDDLEPFTRLLHDHYSSLSAADLNRALRYLQEVGWQVGAAFRDHDLLLTPTLAQPAPPLGLLDTTRPEAIYEHASTYSGFTSVFNVTGMPAVSVPTGTDTTGVPIGVQLAADLGSEGLLLAVAGQLEQARPWSRHAPAPPAGRG